MAIALVAHTKVSPSSNLGGTSPSVDTTGANLITLAITAWASFSIGGASIGDNQGNTYTYIGTTVQDGGNHADLYHYYCFNPTVGAGHTFHVTSGSQSISTLCAAAWSGIDTGTSPVRGNGATNTSGSTSQPGTISVVTDGSLIISSAVVVGFGSPDSPGTWTVNDSFTITDSLANNFTAPNNYGTVSAYLIQGTAGNIQPTFTYANTSQGWGAYSMSFAPAITPSVGSASGTGDAAAVGLALFIAVGSAAGAGDASAVSGTGQLAAGTAAGAGGASGVSAALVSSVGTAAGVGAASGVAKAALLSVGTAAGAGFAFGTGVKEEFPVGTAAGHGNARAVGMMVGRSLPFDIDRAWAIDINGSIIDAVQYDPITDVLRVIYVPPLTIDIGNMPMSITNTIGSSPDPQAYVLGLVASAVN